jgi:hypothetical protein
MRLHSRFMSHHLQQSRDRLERTRAAMDRATLCLGTDDLPAIEKLASESLDDLELCWVQFKHDWLALDVVLAALTVTKAWAARRHLPPSLGIEQLLRRALELRMAWLQGEDAA